MKRAKKMVQCATRVNRDAVRRTSINGVEHVIVSSFTLPDDVVMNGGLYPADEIANSFATLERTLAPVEHPTDANGNYISASDPEAIHNFHAGAFNVNVNQVDGRVHIEKFINVQEALKTDRGRRLMDRIEELETNDTPRPIHTSVGVFLEIEELDKPQTNAAGDEFTWIARNMFFDHDAILLDSVGAAQPSQGVGMAVNAAGEEITAERVMFGDLPEPQAMPDRPDTRDMRVNQEGTSFANIMEDLQKALNNVVTADWIWLVDVFDDLAIFETPQGFFQVPWSMSEGKVELAGIPIRVDRVVTYEPKTNAEGEKEMKFKQIILNALAKAGVKTDGLSDEELVAKYEELQANDNDGGAGGGDGAEPPAAGGVDADMITNAVAAAVKPLQDQVAGLETRLNAQSDEETAKLVEIVVNSKIYPGLDEAGAKALPIDTLKQMAANCGTGYGLPLNINQQDGAGEGFSAPAEMPR
jgi:hypothetical protein